MLLSRFNYQYMEEYAYSKTALAVIEKVMKEYARKEMQLIRCNGVKKETSFDLREYNRNYRYRIKR